MWSAIIAGLAALASGYLAYRGANKQVEKQNKSNMELAKYQTQVQEEMYNKYSSPSAQQQQYVDAGLNPNLVYGSASSGQGNVPSFQAPHVERGLSIGEKLNQTLSMMSQAVGLKQQMYQADAAREAAEQSSIKTLNDLINMRRNSRDYTSENAISGYNEQTLWKRLFRNPRATKAIDVDLVKGDLVTEWDKYNKAARDNYFERMAAAGLQNIQSRRNIEQSELAIAGKQLENYYLEDYLNYRNQQQQLNYELDDSFKKATTINKNLAPWMQSIAGILQSLIRSSRK